MAVDALRLGLYGCGNRTRALLDSLYGEGEYRVVAAYDIVPGAVKTLVERYGGTACASEDELLGCEEADAFLISLDPFAHPDAFDKTLERGKPIFIEKPIALTAERAYRMMTSAREKNVPVHVGFLHRYYEHHKAARKFLHENPPGRLFSVTCNWHHPGETEMINCTNNLPDNFRLKLSQIPFHCCHALDMLMLYGGPVRRVDARGLKLVKRNYPSPDEVIALLEFASGAIGYFHYSSMAYKSCGGSFLIHAENYTMELTGDLFIYRRPATKFLRGEFETDCRDKYHPHTLPEHRKFAHALTDCLIMRDFLGAVRNGMPMKAPIEVGFKVAELAEAIERSWKEKVVIELPMKFA